MCTSPELCELINQFPNAEITIIMLKEIIRFEFDYRKKRPATYIYFVILFLLCFLAVTSQYVSIGGVAGGQIKENGPFNIAFMTIIMTFFFTFICSAIMGVAVLRDFDHKTESMMFTTTMSKFDYLMGRFIGSFLVMILIYSSIFLAFMLGFGLGKYLPWDPSWKEKEMLAFDTWSYIQPFLVFGLTNIFIQGAIFFAAGALSRKTLVIYTQGIILFVLYQIALSILGDIENKNLAALLDPFGLQAFSTYTEYWTPAQKNTQLIPLDGVLLWNRLIWCGFGLLVLIGTHAAFKFEVVTSGIFKRKKKKANVSSEAYIRPETVKIPLVTQFDGFKTHLTMLWMQIKFYFKTTVLEVPFLAIMFVGLVNLIASAFYFDRSYGTSSYPVTANVITLLEGFNLFFLIIIVFYTGELIWKERSVKFNLIIDALPIPDWVNMLSKYIALLLINICTILLLILCGVAIQTALGYTNYELPVYFKAMFTDTLVFIIMYQTMAFFVQSIANNKFIGFAFMFVFFIITFFLDAFGIQHPLVVFDSGSLGRYSDMNRYGHFMTSFSWMKFYWLAFTMFLFVVAIVLSVRGSESVMKTRLRLGRLRLTKNTVSIVLLLLITFFATGCYVFYNTNNLNKYSTRENSEDLRVAYEKELKKYENIAKLKITDVNVKVDIFPESRDFTAAGYYWMRNKTNETISTIHVQNNKQEGVVLDSVSFSQSTTVKEDFEKFGYTIHKLSKPLQPGDSVKMDWKVSFETKGFVASGSNTNVVENGTFFNNTYFPSLGYNSGAEISSDDTRRKKKLPEKERMMEQDNPIGLSQNLFGDNADYINFEITISTSPDQIAIAPGYLQNEWNEGGRRYFNYKMDVPMVNFYSIVSADYEVKKDKWNGVDLEIYYNKGHEYNLETMMTAMKKSFDYYSKNFSPYQFRQMRIMEFPRYSSFAQSFANTVPFSEGIGFIQRVRDPEEDLNMPFYITAHELGHQWWGHQVPDANVRGNTMLSETQSQYSALMVMKQHTTPEMMQKFLKYELNSYLSGRSAERKKEMPLVEVEGQGYIHYRKGSIVMFALQDYIGEERVNTALRNFLKDWQYPGPDHSKGRYPTSRDLLGYFKEQTPDSLQYLIKDMFETITLYENKTNDVTYQKLQNGKYEVIIQSKNEKFRADEKGNEKAIDFSDWMDVGVYTEGKDGQEKLIYLKKHLIKSGANTIKVIVDKKPSMGGVDPVNKLIDRHSDDNRKSASLEEEA
ncbi:MAG: ABC-type transport system involved in multi-copper enzyme maturation permease subunit [Spirosomataceae bacterium]|jgi:ABC-2 type transport system permease protein